MLAVQPTDADTKSLETWNAMKTLPMTLVERCWRIVAPKEILFDVKSASY